jgi:multidrug efflux pump subunit AcrA (membrane-fusion protein)
LMKRRILYIVFALIAGIVVYRLAQFTLSKFSQVEEKEVKKIPVKAVAVKRRDLVTRIELTGDIVGTEVVRVFSQVPGKVHSIRVKEGQRVSKGTVLFKINRDIVGMEYMLALVESPISGYIGEITVDRGMTISPTTPLAQVVSMYTVEAVVHVMEEKINLVQVGMPAIITVEAFPEREFRGRVYKKSAVLDQVSRTQEVRVIIQNTNLALKHGMFANVGIITGRTENAVTVPVDSLFTEGKESFVFTVVEGRAVKKKVRTGITVENFTEITSGVEENEIVITLGHENVDEGDELLVYREDVNASEDELTVKKEKQP